MACYLARAMRDVLLTRGAIAACSMLLACGSETGPAADASAPAGCRQPLGGQASGSHVLRFESATPGVRVHLSRRPSGQGVGESVVHELVGLWVERDGACTAITDRSALRYTNSHHNWRDRAIGTVGGVEYQVSMDFNTDRSAWECGLSAGVALPTTAVVPTGGPIGAWTSPSFLPVHVSELMPENRTSLKDEAGENDPWIELFNPSSEAVDLGGYSLSDDPEQRRRWTFPQGTIIGRHKHLVVFADGQPAQGALHASFRLSTAGGHVVLTGPTGVTGGERTYPALGADKSAVFSPASDAFEPSRMPSPGGGSPE